MNLKKYSSYTFALLLFWGCTTDNKYRSEEEEGFYTKNPYKLGKVELFEGTITLLLKSANEVIELRKKLKDRIPKWSTSSIKKENKNKIPKQPYEIWENFYKNEIQVNIVNQLKKTDNTKLLEDYYNKFGNLFKDPTEENEKALIAAGEKLEANTKLIEAFKTSIAEWYTTPEKIYFTQPIQEYQEFIYFILGKGRSFVKLSISQAHLAKWKKDGHPTGQALWEKIIEMYNKPLNDANYYKYLKNQKAIKESLGLIDKLADNLYGLSYKDLLETIPHGISLIKNILSEVALEEKGDIKLLKTYLELVSSILYQVKSI